MRILVTGGAGYIGSHACKRLLQLGHDLVVIDDLSRGHARAIELLRALPGNSAHRLGFRHAAIDDDATLDHVFAGPPIDAVLHFAAMAYVRESVDRPLDYYRNNVASALPLIEAAMRAEVPRFVFSSSCATYGEPPPERIPIREDCPQQPINPYGWTKLFVERMLLDAQAAVERAGRRAPGIALLRYFNVAGCDRDGILGEDHDPETHLIPIALQVALGRRESLAILGTSHDTPDGTCIRDFIHVEDLVEAHIVAMNALERGQTLAYNLGIGRGYSIREVVESARRVTGHAIPTTQGPAHPGDPPVLFCDPSLIKRDLGWSASITSLDEIIESAWRWFRAHPRGYDDSSPS